MRGRNLYRILVAASLVATSTVLALVPTVARLLAFIVTSVGAGSSWNISMDEFSTILVRTEGGYAFTGGEYLVEKELWAILVNEDDAMVWQQGKPADVSDRYSLINATAFIRWCLGDYSVQIRIQEGGLLVVGGPEGGTWKHPSVLNMDVLKTIPFWLAGLSLLALPGVLGPTALVLGHQFRRRQQERDFARSDRINDISHDIHTPLPMVMGYAEQLEADPVPLPRRRTQVAIIRRQSRTVRDLINDLNLAMRLDYAMQPLWRGSLHLVVLARRVAADVFNSGLGERHALTVEVPSKAEAFTLGGDTSLLRQTLPNLVNSCVCHNPGGCSVILTATTEGEVCALRVEDDGGGGLSDAPAGGRPAPGGGTAHGTGPRLVEQIARAYGSALGLRWTTRGVLAVLRLSL